VGNEKIGCRCKTSGHEEEVFACYNSILRARNEPKRQLGSLRGMINVIRHDGGTPSVDSILTQLSTHTVQRASVLLGLQQTHGNRYVQRQANDIKEKLPIQVKTINSCSKTAPIWLLLSLSHALTG